MHVTDYRSVRALWEQGFYGKGSLSRSEPSWLDREKARKGAADQLTSEEITRQRRAERQQTKWERARKEREAIEQKLLEEAAATSNANGSFPTANGSIEVKAEHNGLAIGSILGRPGAHNLSNAVGYRSNVLNAWDRPQNDGLAAKILDTQSGFAGERSLSKIYPAPVGPSELLALPNSYDVSSLQKPQQVFTPGSCYSAVNGLASAQLIPTNFTKIDGGHAGPADDPELNGRTVTAPNSKTVSDLHNIVNGTAPAPDKAQNGSVEGSPPFSSNGSLGLKRQKSVRFSPQVEKNTFIQTEPPSPAHTLASPTITEDSEIVTREHFQLTLEDAFFLSYGLGVLAIHDPTTKRQLTNRSLFLRFKEHLTSSPKLSQGTWPDDTFLVQYVVYHHFRSLGWVVRGGVKFSVDYLLYARGPVFTHAEFAVIILRSYSDPFWRCDAEKSAYSRKRDEKSWSWLHCTNRVITQVKKTLILVYVDVPPPLDEAQEDHLGIDGLLSRYRIREVTLKRWSPNRSRD